MKVLALNDCASVAATLSRTMPEVDLYQRQGRHVSEFGAKVLSMEGDRIKILPKEGAVKFRHTLKTIAKGYDLIHACGWSAVHAYLLGLPYGMIFHGTDLREWGNPRTLKEKARHMLDSLTLKSAKYVAVSTVDLLPLAKRLRPDAFWMPNPIDLKEFSPAGCSHIYSLAETVTPFAFSPHRIDDTKGHAVVFEAVRRLKWLTVAQPDWGLEPTYSDTKRNAPENVHFIPLISRSKIAEYYRGAIMVLGQTKLGVVGMCELEAAACKRPVVCYSPALFPGLKKPPSRESLMDVIAGIALNADHARSLAETQYRYVVENHDAVKIADKWRGVWKNAVA